MFDETILYEAVSHYTTRFDDVGKPLAVPDGIEGIVGPLPSGWDDTFWDWQPRFDPNGAWVQLVQKKRGALWAEVKQEREMLLSLGLLTDKGVVQIDSASMYELRGRMLRLQLPDAPASVAWTMQDNSTATFTVEEFAVMVAAAEDRVDQIHQWSQAMRAALFDPANDTLEKLAAAAVPLP